MTLSAFFSRSQTKERFLGVNKNKITGGNSFNRDQFEVEGKHESRKDEKILFGIFFKICE